MANLVDEVLQRDENNSAYKTIKVSKAIQPTIDAGNLLISDPNSITLTSYRYLRMRGIVNLNTRQAFL